MDEPFSALDVLTAESLRSEVYGLWTRGDLGLQGMLLITHLIEEAVFLGDRIVIMGTNPGTIRELLTNPLPHPREYRDPAFIALVDRIHAAIIAIHLPDAPAVKAERPPRPHLEPLPYAQVGEIVGLLEVVHDQGDRTNLFALASRLRLEFGLAILAVKAAEVLDLAETPRQEVLLTPLGRAFVAADPNERKRLFHRQLRAIPTFAYLADMLRRAPSRRAHGESLRDDHLVGALRGTARLRSRCPGSVSRCRKHGDRGRPAVTSEPPRPGAHGSNAHHRTASRDSGDSPADSHVQCVDRRAPPDRPCRAHRRGGGAGAAVERAPSPDRRD